MLVELVKVSVGVVGLIKVVREVLVELVVVVVLYIGIDKESLWSIILLTPSLFFSVPPTLLNY